MLYMYIYIHIMCIYIYRGLIATYNNLSVTSLEWWLVSGIIPKWPYFNCAQVVFLHKARWNLPSPFKMYHHGQVVVSSSWWVSTNMFRYALFHLNIWDADDDDDDYESSIGIVINRIIRKKITISRQNYWMIYDYYCDHYYQWYWMIINIIITILIVILTIHYC